MVNGPAAPGSPDRTANLAPFLREGGASAHLICTGVIMTCAGVDAAADAGVDADAGGGVVDAGGTLVESCAATGIARTRPTARVSRLDFTTASLHGTAPFDSSNATASTLRHTRDEFERLLGDGPSTPYRNAAAMLPPSTVRTAPVVLRVRARDTKASATSSAWTSRRNRFPAM